MARTLETLEYADIEDMYDADHCLECNSGTDKLYDDPRDPPLDDGLCLCQDCYKDAFEQRMEELTEEMKNIVKDAMEVIGKEETALIIKEIKGDLSDN